MRKMISSLIMIALFTQNISLSYAGNGELTVTYDFSIQQEADPSIQAIQDNSSSVTSLHLNEVSPRDLESGDENSILNSRITRKSKIIMGALAFMTVAFVGVIVMNEQGLFKGQNLAPASPTGSTQPILPNGPMEISSIAFSNRNWLVKGGFRSPGPNYWSNSTDSVYIDGNGSLVLKVKKSGNIWHSAEVGLAESLGYGIYETQIERPLTYSDPNLMAFSFIYADDAREFDMVHFLNSKDAVEKYSQFAVQPSELPGNMHRFQSRTGSTDSMTYRLNWSAKQALFEALVDGVVVESFTYQ
ncbi:MAG: hypothetical protein ABIQ95_06675, partial [Bdellovibrionia bacterium]